jgi:hypothetical protein
MRSLAIEGPLLFVLALTGALGCGGNNPAERRSNAAGSGGSSTSGGTGGTGGDSAGPTSGGAPQAGAPSGGSTSGGSGGSGGGDSTPIDVTPGVWMNVSPPESNDKCSASVVNRLTGAVSVQVNDGGVWTSTDQATTWTRVDGGTVSGLAVTGPGLDADQMEPTRIAAWSLDGDAGWAADGVTWQKMTAIGRNWDFGATDWSVASPQVLLGALHEAAGAVYLSTDAGTSWDKLSITVLASGGGWPPPAYAMVGVMDATTLIYGDGDGILRSTDSGASFTKVSDENVQTRVPVLFNDVFYLGGEQGLLVSTDKGATWQAQGTSRFMWVGPYFGADENSMMVASSDGVYLTADAGATWTKVAELPEGTGYDPRVWGGYAWDPIHNLIYAAATGSPLMRMKLE